MDKYTFLQSHAAPFAVVLVVIVCTFIPVSAQNIVQEVSLSQAQQEKYLTIR
jgi:hypothetical protein